MWGAFVKLFYSWFIVVVVGRGKGVHFYWFYTLFLFMKVRSVRMKLDSVKDTLWQIPKKAFHFFPFIRCKILLIFCDLTPCITDNTSSNCPLHLLQFLSSLLPIICRYSVQCCDENFPNISHRGYEEKQLNNPNHTPKLTNHILDNIRRGRGGV